MARKRLILITTICLAIALMLPQFAMAAASSPSFSVEASKSALKKGEEVTVTVRGTGLQDVYAYELHLYFNSSLLAFKQGSETSTVVGFSAPATVSETGGTHVVFAHTKTGSGAGNSGSVDLATFTFTAVNEGDAELNLKEIQLIDSNLSTSSVANNFTTSVEVGSGSISNPNPDSGGVTGPTGPSGPTGPTTPAVDPVTVTADQLKDDGEGKATVELTGPATALKLPADTADLLGRTLLNVVAGKAKLEIPAAAFTQLKGQLTEAQLKDGSFLLTINPAAAADPAKFGADTTIAGSTYELTLQWIAADGSSYDIHEFNEPLTIRLAVDASVNPKLASIFYLPDSGLPEFIGGTYENGEFAAQITHFSSYAVLEINKIFSDVPDSHWASEVIKELFAKQIVTGISDTKFEPARNVTRAEFTALLVRALGLTEEGSPAFEDVPADAWYAADVAAAFKAGIVQGVSEAKFAPGANITREEMVTLAMRSYETLNGKPAGAAVESFKDEASISTWALGYVKEAASLGLVQGRAAGEFVPQGSSTRAEAAQMIYRLLNK